MKGRERFDAALARQLGRPDGLPGRLLARVLNRGNRAMVAAAVEAVAPRPGSVVADLGFGGGIGLRLLLERPEVATVVGVDLSAEMVAAARRRFAAAVRSGELRLEPGSLTALPLADASLDGAITVNTAYFLDDLDAALRELARVLRPGARLVVGVGDPEAMAAAPYTAHGFRLRPIAELEAAIATAGLVLVDHRRGPGGKAGSHLLVAADGGAER